MPVLLPNLLNCCYKFVLDVGEVILTAAGHGVLYYYISLLIFLRVDRSVQKGELHGFIYVSRDGYGSCSLLNSSDFISGLLDNFLMGIDFPLNLLDLHIFFGVIQGLQFCFLLLQLLNLTLPLHNLLLLLDNHLIEVAFILPVMFGTSIDLFGLPGWFFIHQLFVIFFNGSIGTAIAHFILL